MDALSLWSGESTSSRPSCCNWYIRLSYTTFTNCDPVPYNIWVWPGGLMSYGYILFPRSPASLTSIQKKSNRQSIQYPGLPPPLKMVFPQFRWLKPLGFSNGGSVNTAHGCNGGCGSRTSHHPFIAPVALSIPDGFLKCEFVKENIGNTQQNRKQDDTLNLYTASWSI